MIGLLVIICALIVYSAGHSLTFRWLWKKEHGAEYNALADPSDPGIEVRAHVWPVYVPFRLYADLVKRASEIIARWKVPEGETLLVGHVRRVKNRAHASVIVATSFVTLFFVL